MARSPSDDPLDRLLRRSLGQRAATEGGVCPDPDLLAAYVDGALGRDEAGGVERHAASCARCTQILAAAVAAEPALPGAERPSVWFSWRSWAWAVPMATAGIVAGVWFVTMRPEVRRDGDIASVAIPTETEQPRPAIVDGARTAPVSPSPVPSPADAREESRQALPGRLAQGSVKSERDEAVSVDARERNVENIELSQQFRTRADAPPSASPPAALADEAQNQAAAPPAPAPPPPAPTLPPPPATRPVQEGTVASPETGVAGGTAVGRGGGGRGGGGAGRGGAAAAPAPVAESARTALSASAPPVTAPTRDPNIIWRWRGNAIERTSDGGAVWVVEYTADRPIAGGAAASTEVAWFFGRGGLVLRRTPAGWAVARAPANAEIVSLAPTSATEATARLADGRQIQTRDGGATWTQP